MYSANFDLQDVIFQSSHTCVVLRAWSPRAPQVSVPCPEVVYLGDEAANHGYWRLLQNHCSCSHILLWYCSSFDTLHTLRAWIAFYLQEGWKKSPSVLWSRDSGLKQPDLFLQGKHKNMRLLWQNKNLLGTDRKAVNKTYLRFQLFVESIQFGSVDQVLCLLIPRSSVERVRQWSIKIALFKGITNSISIFRHSF